MLDSTLLKRCSKCGVEKPPSDFHKNRNTNDGLVPWCKSCVKNYQVEYRQRPESIQKRIEYSHLPEVREKHRLFSHDFYARPDKREHRRLHMKEYNQRADVKERDKARRQSSEAKEERRQYQKEYRDKAKTKLRAYHQRPDVREKKNNWWRVNPDKRREKEGRRRARKFGVDSNFTASDWQRALDYWNGRCAICGRPAGLWHWIAQDHWIAIANGGKHTADNVLPLCHSKPDCPSGEPSCNNTKSDKDPIRWLLDQLGKRKGQRKLEEIQAYFEWTKRQG